MVASLSIYSVSTMLAGCGNKGALQLPPKTNAKDVRDDVKRIRINHSVSAKLNKT